MPLRPRLPRLPHRASLLALAASLALGVVPAHAGPLSPPSPVAACYPASALVARPGERSPVKADQRYDKADLTRALAPYTPIPPALRGAIRRVELPPGRKLIALTLDLCEQPGEIAGYDGAIVDYLRANNVRATFFAGGKWLLSHEQRARQLIADPLFEIANHSWSHRNLRLLAPAEMNREIEGPQRAFEAVRARLLTEQCLVNHLPDAERRLPPRMTLFRFPFGACNAASLKAVNDAGLLAIQWDLSTGDPSPGQSAHAIARAMLKQARPGSIIIAHANGRGHHTAEALPLAIPKLKAAGFEFVTVSELLAAGRPVIEERCYDSRPGDTDRYDSWFRRPAASAGTPPAATTAATRSPVTPPRPQSQ